MFATILKILVSAAIVAFLLGRADRAELIGQLHAFDLTALVVTMGIMLPTLPVQALRYSRIAELKGRLPFRSSLAIVWIGSFFSQTLPSSVGGDPFRIWYLKQNGYSLRDGFLITLADRVFGFLSLIFLVAVGLPWLSHLTNEILLILCAWALVVSGMCLWLTALHLHRFIPILPAPLRAARLTSLMIDTSRFMRDATLSARILAPGLGLSLVGQILQVIAAYYVADKMELNVGFAPLLFFMPIASLAAFLPVSIAGWGIREAVMVGTFGLIGVSNEGALALSISLGIVQLLISLPGLVFWLAIRR